MEQEDIYAYVPTEYNDIEGGRVVFKPDSTRSERSVCPLVAPGALGGKYANGGSAVYEQIERNGEKIDSLALSTVNYNSFIPIMKDGKPFEHVSADTPVSASVKFTEYVPAKRYLTTGEIIEKAESSEIDVSTI